MTPGKYRRGGEGQEIRFTTLESSFGDVLVAATDRGVCSIKNGDYADHLVEELGREFFNAGRIEREDEAPRRWGEPIVSYLDGVHAHPNVPIDVQGTDFQRRVSQSLQKFHTVKLDPTAKSLKCWAGRAQRGPWPEHAQAILSR